MPLSVYLSENVEPITLADALVAAAPKPVQAAYRGYLAQVAKWQEAETACVELRARSRDIDHEAAQAALTAAREGKPIPPAKLDGIAQSIEAAERAVDAHLRLAQEAEQTLLDVLDEHADDIERATNAHAHSVTRRLLDRIGEVLAAEWAEYLGAQHLVVACELGKPWLTPGMAPRFRYMGHDRPINELLGDVLKIIDRSDPVVASEHAEITRLQRTGHPADWDTAMQRYAALPVPGWATALEVQS